MYAPGRRSHPKYEGSCAARTLRCGCIGAAGTRMKRGMDAEDVETVSLRHGCTDGNGSTISQKDPSHAQFPTHIIPGCPPVTDVFFFQTPYSVSACFAHLLVISYILTPIRHDTLYYTHSSLCILQTLTLIHLRFILTSQPSLRSLK
jgi:hypothetical protein